MACSAGASLRSDQSGAILVPALVMGALLTGALFYIAAVGDAVIFRTELQNAADMTSFKNAVWHARGMNVIAVLNVLMSAALAVFAVLRIAEIVCFLIGLIPVIGAPVAGVAQTLVSQEQTIARFVNSALNIAAGAEDAVSMSVPYVALGDAKLTPTYASTVWPLSMSLIPPVVDREVGKTPRRPEKSPAALPIQDGDFGLLCGKAVAFIPNQITGLIDRLPDPPIIGGMFRGAVKKVVDVIVDDVIVHVFGLGDGIFCQPLTGMLTSLVSLLSDDACNETRSQDDNAREQRKNDADDATKDGGTLSKEDQDQRDKDEKAKPVKCGQGSDDNPDAKGTSGIQFSARPSVMWEMASNGNVFMHNWSWVSGEPRLFNPTEKGLAIADHGRMPAVTPATGATAMSEFYFDCDEGWGEHCEKDAPWSPNWTARVRRFRSPGEELLRVGLDTMTDKLDNAQKSIGEHAGDLAGDAVAKLSGIPSDNPISDWVADRVEEIPVVHALSEKIDQVVGGLRSSTGIDELLDPRRYSDERRVH